MQAVVFGLGSMGKRRIRLLKEYPDIIIYGVDNDSLRCKEAEELFHIKTLSDISKISIVPQNDCAFICTSPLSHSVLIKECLEHELNVFTEINLVTDGYEENVSLAEAKGRVLFLSSPFLYRPETGYIANRVKKTAEPVNYIYHVGQYLPDWHPWEQYKRFFVENPRTNGCRELFSVELPWIVSCFGRIKSVSAQKSKNTGLDITYNDNYLVQILHENGNKGIVAVDVISRKAVRKLEVFSENIYLTWGGNTDDLLEYDIKNRQDTKVDVGTGEHADGYATIITEEPFRKEIEVFFDAAFNGKKERVLWDFKRDFEVLRTIDEIEG